MNKFSCVGHETCVVVDSSVWDGLVLEAFPADSSFIEPHDFTRNTSTELQR